MKKLNRFIKFNLVLGFIFVTYGTLSKLLGLYFFWESEFIGKGIILIALIGLLLDRIKLKTKSNKESLLEKIGIVLLSSIILFPLVHFAVSDDLKEAYSVTKEYVQTNEDLRHELGEIKGISIVPSYAIEYNTKASGENSKALIQLIVKGNRRFADLTAYLEKVEGQTQWTVISTDM